MHKHQQYAGIDSEQFVNRCIMEIEFFGAAKTVTGSQHLLTLNGKKVLLDCGLFQGRRSEANIINRNMHWDAKNIDAVVLSHAHIDHAGTIPTLVKNGFKGQIYATPATRDLCAIMLADSAMIQMKDAQFLYKHKAEIVEPLYTIDDVADAMSLFNTIAYRKSFSPIPDMTVTFFDAGHLLGSAAVLVEYIEQGTTKKLLFTGDVGRPGRPILRDPEAVGDVDYIISESTYGGRLHEEEGNTERELLDIIHEVIHKNGKLIIEVPYWVSSLDSLKFDQIYHEHVSYFTLRSLDYLAKISNFYITKFEVIDYHGGSLRVELSIKSSSVENRQVETQIKWESDLGVFDLNFYVDFMKRIKVNRSVFLERLHRILATENEKKIVLIGAAAKANTFINYYKLDSTMINFITDSSESKIGKKTPLSRIPIVDDLALKDLGKVYAIITSWNISESLRKKLLSINPEIEYITS